MSKTMTAAIEILIYAAVLDLYKRQNARAFAISGKLSNAMLDVVDWQARPWPFEK